MTTAQRVIKYIAIAFAALLVAAIVLGIYYGVGALLDIGSDDSTGVMSGLEVSGEPTSLDIDVKSVGIEIKTGDAFKLETDSRYITAKLSNGTLKIEEKSRGWFKTDPAGELIITLPDGKNFGSVEIDAGAGVINIETLTADKIDLDLGAGAVTVDSIIATKKADIDGGAGKITVKNGDLYDLELNMGVGELDMTAKLSGKASVDCGVGKTGITLKGTAADYSIRADKGIGSAELDGEAMQSGKTYGNGASTIDIDGGVGNIEIDFE